MSSIRTEWVTLDTNVYIHAFRMEQGREACTRLVFDHFAGLRVFIPLQVISELHRNLRPHEFGHLYRAASLSLHAKVEYAPAVSDRLVYYESLGAKKGDAAIAAQLDAARIQWLVSENRHFLAQIPDLPFRVVSADEALEMLTK